MLECRACALRYARAIAGDGFALHATQRSLILTPRISIPFKRQLATAATSTAPIASKRSIRPTRDNEVSRSDSDREKAVAEAGFDDKALKIELRYLKDPLKLANHVHLILRNKQPEKALALVRLASKSMSCVVSWNHIINFLMQQKRLNKAFEVYNEMKKRAQFPDSYTYLHILRGLAVQTHHGEVIRRENAEKAIGVYGSMSSPTSKVKPAVLHSNAALRVCALALDTDAMWSIVEKMPQSGTGSPDAVTYTTILNAIRHSAFGRNPEGVSLEQIAARRQKAVNEGRRIWLDVVKRWRAGEVAIDEDLVVAMARLLLISKRLSDWDDVLNLIQQTMHIERQIAPIGSEGRNTGHVPQEGDGPTAEEEDPEGFVGTPAARAFAVVPAPSTAVERTQQQKASTSTKSSIAWVQPGNPTLSVLLEACTLLRTPRTATAYWTTITSPPYDIKADVANFDSLISLYAKNRSSARVAETLSVDMPRVGVKPRNSTFRVAMNACSRDHKNHNVLEHAWTIVRIMEAEHADPDAHTLSQYISLALATNDGPKIVDAIDRLDPVVHNLRSRILYGSDAMQQNTYEEIRDRREGILFLQTLVGAIDTLISRALISRESMGSWNARRSDLTRYLARAQKNVEKFGSRADWLKKYGSLKSDGEGGTFLLSRAQRRAKFTTEKAAQPQRAALKAFKQGDRRSASFPDKSDAPYGVRAAGRKGLDGFTDSPSGIGWT